MAKKTITPLRAARLDRGLTLADVERLTGIEASRLSRLERNQAEPSKSEILQLVKFHRKRINEMQILFPERYKIKR